MTRLLLSWRANSLFTLSDRVSRTSTPRPYSFRSNRVTASPIYPLGFCATLSRTFRSRCLLKKACMSPRNFARVFKAVFGKAPADFVASARIAEARRRLRVPRNSIESVAFSVGFRSARTFCRAFARYVGCQPSGAELRQRLFIFRALLRTRLSSRQSPWLKASLLCPNGKTHSALYRRTWRN